MDDPDDGSYRSVRFAVERGRTTGRVAVDDEPDDVRFRDFDELLAGDEETRSVTGARVGAAFEQLRGGRPGQDAA